MKAVINKATGLMIESQSDAANNAALIANALALGYDDVTISIVDDAEHAALIAAREALQPKAVPAEITMRQARLALLGAGKLAAVDTAINAMDEPAKSAAKIEWEYSNTVQRHNGFVTALGPALGLTDAQIDALFLAAQAL